MLRVLFGYEKHLQMVDDVYKDGSADDEKLSKFITYLKSRTSIIPSTLDYLRVRAREEVHNIHRLKIGSKLLRQIIDQLRGVSICYESRIIRIFVGVIKEILRLKRNGDFEYSDHQEFLDVFKHFFGTVPIRAYESERYIRKILFIATEATKVTVSSDGAETGFDDEDGRVVDDGGEAYGRAGISDDETSSLTDLEKYKNEERGEISNARFEYFFLEVMHTLMEVEDILRIDHDEKYKWLVGSLMKREEVNSAKRIEIFRLVAGKANIISGNSLIYYVLKYGSCMRKSCARILTEHLEPDLYPQIILQVNMNILERGKKLYRDRRGAGDSRAVEECEFLAQEGVEVLSSYEVLHLNQKEIVLSFFSIFEMFFSGEDDKFLFIVSYAREYFEKCRPISDVFYRFLKKIFQEQEPGRYTENFRAAMFGEIQRYFVVHSDCIPNARFMTLLLNSAVGEFVPFCCKILYLAKDYFMARTLNPFMRERAMGRLRALFYQTGNRDILYLLVDVVGHDASRDDQYKTLCLFSEKKILREQLVREMYKGRYSSVSEILSSEFGCESLKPYDLDEDRRICETVDPGGKARNCEYLMSGTRRCTRIALIDYERHFR
uniref:Uncharacterized protein n=1 Tax=Encephalitozoon cuniculi TaxID=6035 RepID=M1K3R8_ENCCN|nr:hypothetical protein ECU02_0560 [Encephalitozoon cuniculi]